ncbi:MAG: hypothetical protein MK105_18310 [Crocinitomicaceae bacterium]|nr:hypothetical protein [Crocinitomicaceae bacterium]
MFAPFDKWETPRIGIDFGGVIVKPSNEENPLNPDFGLDIQQDGAIESIKELVLMSKSNLWIISKASKPTQHLTRKWLNKVNFYQKTGFYASNLLFCCKRSEKAKLSQPLNLTHFIDDRLDVLENLKDLIPNLFLFGKDYAPNGIFPVKNWQTLLNTITKGC